MPLDLDPFQYLPLRGGFLLQSVTINEEPMLDAAGRLALARTSIVGINLQIELAAANLDLTGMSVSIYHEVLEAAAVASLFPPGKVCEMNEGDFEAAAQECQRLYGVVTPDHLNSMLECFGF